MKLAEEEHLATATSGSKFEEQPLLVMSRSLRPDLETSKRMSPWAAQ